MKPACATAEYASIRLTSVCVTAVTVPTTMVAIAITHSTGRQSARSSGTAT
jgi:multidrug efflux pump subunit AcrB